MRTIFITLFLAPLLAACTPEHVRKAEDIYNNPNNVQRIVYDDARTKALRSMLPEYYQVQKGDAEGRTFGASISGAAAGISVATQQGITNVAKANSASEALNAGNKAAANQANYAIIGAAVGNVAAVMIDEARSKEQLRKLYGIQDIPGDASNKLILILIDPLSQLKALNFIGATMALREAPEPRLGQLYVDAAYSTMRACRLTPPENPALNKHCHTAFNIMASLNLPTVLEGSPPNDEKMAPQNYMPK